MRIKMKINRSNYLIEFIGSKQSIQYLFFSSILAGAMQMLILTIDSHVLE